MTTSDPIATSATGPTKASRFANFPPNQLPAPASAAIQIVDPAAVQSRNFAWFIFTIPAGSDIDMHEQGVHLRLAPLRLALHAGRSESVCVVANGG